MPKGHSLRLTAAAAAELGRQAAVAGTPGLMHIDLIDGSCERWVIRIRATGQVRCCACGASFSPIA